MSDNACLYWDKDSAKGFVADTDTLDRGKDVVQSGHEGGGYKPHEVKERS